jgi:hypothetical protein
MSNRRLAFVVVAPRVLAVLAPNWSNNRLGLNAYFNDRLPGAWGYHINGSGFLGRAETGATIRG